MRGELMLNCARLAEKIRLGNTGDDKGLSVIPEPSLDEIEKSGEASITLRLGRWFVVIRQSSHPFFDVLPGSSEARSTRKYFVPFTKEFVLHPGSFVLASTLEWLRFPVDLGGYVGGKSTWARRGLIIETAAGIHPGFSGCLTLELANLGVVPFKIRPGMKICQVFVHSVHEGEIPSTGPLTGRRRPHLGALSPDPILAKLSK
jgi:dCTP deaminase